MKVAIVHDYLTQRGGAERVVLSMLHAFPGAPIYTSLYDPEGTFPEFRDADVRTMPIDGLRILRKHHRLALPLLAPCFTSMSVGADVVLCDSSGWAHGCSVTGRKVVYCHTPARWLYETADQYLGDRLSVGRVALSALRRPLRNWDKRAAAKAHRYVTGSKVVQRRIRDTYGRDAEVLPSPPAVGPDGDQTPVAGVEPGFFLVVARLLPYKNVGAIVDAFALLPDQRLVVVGAGPEAHRLRASAPPNVRMLGAVREDAQLRWLYAQCSAVVAASYEDFGLTPLEAGGFGKPAVVLRLGGFLETVVEGSTGVFFDRPEPADIAEAVRSLLCRPLPPQPIIEHVELFSEKRFIARLHEIVEEELAVTRTPLTVALARST